MATGSVTSAARGSGPEQPAISAARGADPGVSFSATRGAEVPASQAHPGVASCPAADIVDLPDSFAIVPVLVKTDAESQTQWLHDDGLLGRPFVFLSGHGECYHTAVDCYGLRNVSMPQRLRSCNFCCCAQPKFSERPRTQV